MATVTKTGHVNNAIRFIEKIGSIYVGIGVNGVSNNEDAFTNLYGVKRAEVVSLARLIDPSENFLGSFIEYGGNKYELVSQGEAYNKNAHFIYVKASILPDELQGTSYDTAGILTSPKFSPNVTADIIPSSSIENQGYLEMYDSRDVIDRSAIKITEQFIIEA